MNSMRIVEGNGRARVQERAHDEPGNIERQSRPNSGFCNNPLMRITSKDMPQ